MRKLFGTDGLRGVAGEPPLDPDTLYRLGFGLVSWLRGSGADEPVPRICIGRDTRESCEAIVARLADGIGESGGAAVDVEVLPTPALALLTRRDEFAAGLMVSASHNPFQDNGVKVFDGRGSKLPDDAEARLERLMEAAPPPRPEGPGHTAERQGRLRDEYLGFLESCLEGVRLEGARIVLDTAHGAATALAPRTFENAGASVVTIGNAPDGRNINDGVGSLHPEIVAAAVLEKRADLGFAFDGDADRCVAVSNSGRVLDGDFILYYLGRALKAAGRLPGSAVVSTVMSNLGLEKALEREGIRMHRAPVGDRYVLEEMLARGCRLGGEQSGHVILLDYAPTGDGLLTALTLARLWRCGAGDLDETLDAIPRFPQILRNVRVSAKPAIDSHPVLSDAVRRAERRLGPDGRIVVRYSGTEPKARVMIEGLEARSVEELADELVEVFRRELGVTDGG